FEASPELFLVRRGLAGRARADRRRQGRTASPAFPCALRLRRARRPRNGAGPGRREADWLLRGERRPVVQGRVGGRCKGRIARAAVLARSDGVLVHVRLAAPPPICDGVGAPTPRPPSRE